MNETTQDTNTILVGGVTFVNKVHVVKLYNVARASLQALKELLPEPDGLDPETQDCVILALEEQLKNVEEVINISTPEVV